MGPILIKNPIVPDMSVMLCTKATFVKKNSCLVARIILFDADVCIYLLSSHTRPKIFSH